MPEQNHTHRRRVVSPVLPVTNPDLPSQNLRSIISGNPSHTAQSFPCDAISDRRGQHTCPGKVQNFHFWVLIEIFYYHHYVRLKINFAIYSPAVCLTMRSIEAFRQRSFSALTFDGTTVGRKNITIVPAVFSIIIGTATAHLYTGYAGPETSKTGSELT